MYVVGSGFDGGADNSTLEVPELGRRIVGYHVEFLNRIGSGLITNEIV